MKNLLATTLLALILSACATSGQKIDPSKVSKITKGVTTRAQVEAQLGSPEHVSIDPASGNRVLMYSYSEAQANVAMLIPFVELVAGGVRSKQQVLEVVVDKSGIVRDYELHNSTNYIGGPLGRD